MALSEKHRHAMYEDFVSQLGEEVTEAMMSHYPARDVEEPVTKEFLKSETTLVRMELHEGMTGLREELTGELHSQIAGVNTRIDSLAATVDGRMRQQFFWLMGAMLTMIASMVAVLVTILVRMP